MKNNANNLNQDQLNELENDAVWTLLEDTEKASPVEASPMFARNVMREIRLTESAPTLWQRVFAPKFNKVALALGATAACAALAITMMPAQNAGSDTLADDTGLLEGFEDLSIDELADLEGASLTDLEADTFTNEMLDLAGQDPFYISEEEIEIAMQM